MGWWYNLRYDPTPGVLNIGVGVANPNDTERLRIDGQGNYCFRGIKFHQ